MTDRHHAFRFAQLRVTGPTFTKAQHQAGQPQPQHPALPQKTCTRLASSAHTTWPALPSPAKQAGHKAKQYYFHAQPRQQHFAHPILPGGAPSPKCQTRAVSASPGLACSSCKQKHAVPQLQLRQRLYWVSVQPAQCAAVHAGSSISCKPQGLPDTFRCFYLLLSLKLFGCVLLLACALFSHRSCVAGSYGPHFPCGLNRYSEPSAQSASECFCAPGALLGMHTHAQIWFKPTASLSKPGQLLSWWQGGTYHHL